MQKNILAIHDISCLGRCSMTVALPILSACGLETSVMPTAILSTHPSGFTNFTYTDLTDNIKPISNHWQKENIKFDALYSGFLGSILQIDLVKDLFLQHKKENSLIVVDPVMADNGKLYSVYDDNMVIEMKKLCSIADIIVPNLTEACFLLGREYKATDYGEDYILNLAYDLSKLGCKKIILTGISFESDKIGAFCFDSESSKHFYVCNKKISGNFHGTGDIFSSVLTASIMNDFSLQESSQIATDTVVKCIEESLKLNREKRYGVSFEKALPFLIKRLGLLDLE